MRCRQRCRTDACSFRRFLDLNLADEIWDNSTFTVNPARRSNTTRPDSASTTAGQAQERGGRSARCGDEPVETVAPQME